MIGMVFGKLTIVAEARRGTRGVSWVCNCECGNQVRKTTYQLEHNPKITCGCFRDKWDDIEKVPRYQRKRYPLTYSSWRNMWCRVKYQPGCYKGVTICEGWRRFMSFVRDVGPRPSRNHSIDRIDPDGGYFPDNCQWLTISENCAKIRGNYGEERNRKLSNSMRQGFASGRLKVSEYTRKAVSEGAKKRIGRKLQVCEGCGGKSYLTLCQRCRGNISKKR